MGGKKFVYTKNYFFYSVVGLTFYSPLIFVSIIQRCVGLFLKMLDSNPGPAPSAVWSITVSSNNSSNSGPSSFLSAFSQHCFVYNKNLNFMTKTEDQRTRVTCVNYL